jgi:hypothetical protein
VSATGCGRIGFTPLPAGGDAGSWWDPDWAFRKTLVIDRARGVNDLADFPVLVELVDPALAAHARPDGLDLAFVDPAGNLLAHELERLSPTLDAWVKIPVLPVATVTTIYLYYGNPSSSATPDPAKVWSNAYTGVYHFGDGITLDARDSTGANHGTNNGATATTAGRIHGGVDFTGGPTITAPTAGVDSSANGFNTVTLWMLNTGNVDDAPVSFGPVGNTYDLWFLRDDCFGFNTENGEVLGTTIGGLMNRWVHVAAIFRNGIPSTSGNTLFIDGVGQVLTTCNGGAANARTVGGTLSWASNNGYELDGLLDEGRVARGPRTAGWLITEYENQSAPGAFVTAGPEETGP